MIRSRLTALAILSCAMTVGAHAQTQVAFIGGDFTYNWQQNPDFSSHSNWQADGIAQPSGPIGPCYEAGPTLRALQTIIASGKKPIIHLITGEGDVDAVTPGNQADFIFESFATCFEQIVTTAQAAKLKIIVGTDPFSLYGNIDLANQWVRMYCAQHNIPLVDYETILYNAANNPTYSQAGGLWSTTTPNSQVPGWLPVPSQAAYDMITSAAELAIGQVAGTLTLKAGFLGTSTQEDYEDAPVEQGLNTVVAGSPVWFTAYGQWSDGKTRVINNPNVNLSNTNAVGVMGTWTTSNPYVMTIDQTGYAKALRPGAANIKFTTLTGATINEWTMSVDLGCPVTCSSINY